MATLFSGGVDSFFTLHRSSAGAPGVPPVSHLLFVEGLEQPLSTTRGAAEAVAQVRQHARQSGHTVVEIRMAPVLLEEVPDVRLHDDELARRRCRG